MGEVAGIAAPGGQAPSDRLPWHAAVGAADACTAVARILAGKPVLPPGPGAGEIRAENGVVFLGQLLFAVRVANGISPRADALAGDGRGDELARRFLAEGSVEVCCGHCGMLMLNSVAQVMAALMEGMHGDAAVSHWLAMTTAIGISLTGHDRRDREPDFRP